MTTLKKLTLLSFIFVLTFNIYSQGWIQQNSGTTLNLNSVYFINANTGFIAADSGRILRTTNGGVNWILTNTGVNRKIYSIQFINSNSGFASFENKVIKTTNTGISWDTTVNGGGKSISFLNSTTGFSLKQLYMPVVWRTTNSGSTWDSINFIPNLIGPVHKVLFINENTGFACGNEYTLSFQFYNARIYKTTNGGVNWLVAYNGPNIPNSTDVFNITYVTNYCFAVGYEGNENKFFRSTNSGSNWNVSTLPNRFLAIKFIDINIGLLVGESGKILYTSNSGIGWNEQNSGVNSTLLDLFMVDYNTGYITGNNGVILKTTNGGFTSIQQTGINTPDKYFLNQNYPNPFNPNTQISFDIPKSSFVKLIVYDAAGREIEILVNENLKAGSYSVNWDAWSYPSGVYFYKLIGEDFTITKKMVLIK